jgi:hypothetical protein
MPRRFHAMRVARERHGPLKMACPWAGAGLAWKRSVVIRRGILRPYFLFHDLRKSGTNKAFATWQ